MRIGVLMPTFNRPDLVRASVLQLAHQSHRPDVICIHQNGHSDSYQWAIADLALVPRVIWLHTPSTLRQHDWYSIPIKRLLDEGCTHFFWADHDDVYLHRHIELGLKDLEAFDFSIALRVGLLYTRPTDYRYVPEIDFTAHAPGGMSSTMCFRHRFAEELLADIARDEYRTYYTDNVLAKVTMPKFRCHISRKRPTCIYHSHDGSLTSRDWLDTQLPPRQDDEG